jgi:hypothetical protein
MKNTAYKNILVLLFCLYEFSKNTLNIRVINRREMHNSNNLVVTAIPNDHSFDKGGNSVTSVKLLANSLKNLSKEGSCERKSTTKTTTVIIISSARYRLSFIVDTIKYVNISNGTMIATKYNTLLLSESEFVSLFITLNIRIKYKINTKNNEFL